ncbi:helix-turn-helix domain-containing protein (plasmid) [Borreliella americana]|uniref:Helix-turn-helix domain-containing protein n=1 Tax=Borreliella americana TaxID=478807 RepID=A0ACD5G5I8_9SPIR
MLIELINIERINIEYIPTPIKKYFLKLFRCLRCLYNKMLINRRDYYEENKKSLGTNLSKYKNKFPSLK